MNDGGMMYDDDGSAFSDGLMDGKTTDRSDNSDKEIQRMHITK